MIRPKDMRKRAHLVRLIETLDEPTASAVLTIIETMSLVDRRRASALLEAVSFLLARAPRRPPRKGAAR